ncbi:hypothetical protein [Candidatus Parabeggiatoa sp. HSG14]|uniref:hypothetical protein n=1 Tax=Candidatus Parabeggiatoa sp. HSG14 TaxID=3055593 RepID=UPI0025A8FB85|nr:hypothetical protein [Thiotrichales bacterium HSG14]
MSDIFTTEELSALSAQVDEQLRELGKGYEPGMRKGETQLFSMEDDLPPKQRKDIEDNSKKEAHSFLQEFADKAKEILCNAESDLRKDYELLGEVNKVTLLERLAVLLTVMGFSGIGLQILTVAVTVYIIHVGLKPFADKYCK